MNTTASSWKDKIVPPDRVFEEIKPGMTIFLGTGMAEPRTLVKHLMASSRANLQDLEMIQLVSLGDAVSIDERYSSKYRLKTFYSGWVASTAITAGRVDLIPSRFSRIPWLFRSGAVHIDVAFIQITPPDENGYASLGLGVDVTRYAMDKAALVVGEINEDIPRTLGDTFVHINDFNYLVQSTEPPIYMPRWPVPEYYEKIGARIAAIVDDGSCLCFSIGPVYEALACHLRHKKNLGVHTPFFTDALMELVKGGVVTNRFKGFFRGKCLASYVMGTQKLMTWLDRNPFVDFQSLDVVMDPRNIGLNERFIAILPARKADLTGCIALHAGMAGPGAVQELLAGALLSREGRTIFALPSRNPRGDSNILVSIEDFPNQFTNREDLDMVATEYGIAYLSGRTVRERAQAMIDIAHPDDRAELVRQAKEAKLLYPDQIFFTGSGHLYPSDISMTQTFRGSVAVRFRPIKPSDEEEMRRLFYRFSEQAVYYRYFSSVKAMPHGKMQEYVNVDYRTVMSIVGVIKEGRGEHVIAEGRYVRLKDRPYADVAFVVDEAYQGMGIASFVFGMLVRFARERGGIEGFTADVLADNKAAMRIFKKSAALSVQANLSGEAYELTMPFRNHERGDGTGRSPEERKIRS
jgi:acyl-CoA hydrolase/RimJ/RimL family protein N-acetyltransferase